MQLLSDDEVAAKLTERASLAEALTGAQTAASTAQVPTQVFSRAILIDCYLQAEVQAWQSRAAETQALVKNARAQVAALVPVTAVLDVQVARLAFDSLCTSVSPWQLHSIAPIAVQEGISSVRLGLGLADGSSVELDVASANKCVVAARWLVFPAVAREFLAALSLSQDGADISIDKVVADGKTLIGPWLATLADKICFALRVSREMAALQLSCGALCPHAGAIEIPFARFQCVLFI
jgi:hypothetical protein